MFLSRRRFMLSTTGALVGPSQARVAWPAQALQAAGPKHYSPTWQPNATLLRNLPRLLDLSSVPGLALGVVEESRIWIRGFGRAVEDPAEDASPETVFEGASLGKPLFAYAVLRLVDAKVLDLD